MTTFTHYLDSIRDDQTAIEDGCSSANYKQLREKAGKVARYFHNKYGKKQRILLRSSLSTDFVITLLGIIYSGNTPVPIDSQLFGETLRLVKEKMQACAVTDPITSERYHDVVPLYQTSGSIPVMILLTSGTSGLPKGVSISHANLIFSCQAISGYLCYGKYPSAAVVLPMYYSYGILSQLCCMLFVGGFVRLIPEFRNVLEFSRIVNELKLKTFCGVPSTFITLVRLNRMRSIEMPDVKILCCAGAAMNREIFNEVKEIFPNSLFFNNYGLTEATPRVSYIREDDSRFFDPTCGRPIRGVEVKIIDPDSHVTIPEREQGILAIRGPNVTQGYWNDDELTYQAFTQDGYLISGDIAYLDQGYIYLKGRCDDIFNVGGEKVAPLEIEHVLNVVDAIELSAVRGVEDELRGHVPVAFLRLNRATTRKQLVDELAKQLVATKIPTRFFEVNRFPMTRNGKLQRNKLSINSDYIVKEII